MYIVLAIILLAAAGVVYYFLGQPDIESYSCMTTSEQKRKAIESAKTTRELDGMWRAWSRSGYSREGLLHAELLQRKKALGETLSKEDEQRIVDADRAWKRAKNLPTITGRGR